MNLPPDFTERMKKDLGNEFESFISVYDNPPFYAARANTLKISAEDFKNLTGFCEKQVPWCRDAFYYKGKQGLHPASAAGLFYSQEPSACAAAEMLPIEKGDRVLDLCAAPGGKSTQLASKLDGCGLLVANEISPKRARILCENIIRCGIKNAVVTNMRPDDLENHFKGFFDKVLVDAPCSGEGMFRKDEQAIRDWSLEHTYACAARQFEILKSAFKMLRPGGKLVYSTCTFSWCENEGVCEKAESIDGVRMERCIRIMPHQYEGEGHFAALFEKDGYSERVIRENCRNPAGEAEKIYREFEKENLRAELGGAMTVFGNLLYLTPSETGSLDKIRCLLPGLMLGEVKKGRFVPSHHLCVSLKKEEFVRNYPLSEEEIKKYLFGESIFRETEEGFGAALYAGKYPLGWYKSSKGQLKNHYPKYLRERR